METYRTSLETAPDRLEERRVYRFRARNFFFGVWNGERGDLCGFIGIREKMSSIYLFTEYHCDTGGPVGTVWDIQPTEHLVPEDIEIRERFESRCDICEQPTKFEPDIPFARAPGRHYHVDQTLDADHDPHRHAYLPGNPALMRWLAGLIEPDDHGDGFKEYVIALLDAPDTDAQEAVMEDWLQKQRARREAAWKERA